MTDQRIEAAAKALFESTRTDYMTWEHAADETRELYRSRMRRNVDAYLAAADNASIITTIDELDALPVGTVVSSDGYKYSRNYPHYPVSFQKLYNGLWHRGGRTADTHPEYIIPAHVIHWGKP